MDDIAHSPHAERARFTYSAAADHYDLPTLSFWNRFGEETARRIPVCPGDRVVDLCCGSGASALAAARASGSGGHVIGMDVADGLLRLARDKASRHGLDNVEFVHHDATDTGLPDASADVVICVFGVFFAPDQAAFVSEMWRLVAPGGALAITTWGPGVFEPANSHFWEAVNEVEPSLYKAFNPWDALTSPDALAGLFASAGTAPPTISFVAGRHRLTDPADFWHVVMGSGYRGTVDALDPSAQARLHRLVDERLAAEQVLDIGVDVIYAVAHKPR